MAYRGCLLVFAIWAMTGIALAAPPLRALIVDGQNTHPWTETSPLLKRYLEETGLFAVDRATSPPRGQEMGRFKPHFAGYNVVVDNYYGDPWPEETKRPWPPTFPAAGGL